MDPEVIGLLTNFIQSGQERFSYRAKNVIVVKAVVKYCQNRVMSFIEIFNKCLRQKKRLTGLSYLVCLELHHPGPRWLSHHKRGRVRSRLCWRHLSAKIKIRALNVDEIDPWCRFHQHFTRTFFVRISFRRIFLVTCK